MSPTSRNLSGAAALVIALALAVTAAPVGADAAAPAAAATKTTPKYPDHTGIVATTFWVGEIFDPDAADGSQRISTYDDHWYRNYGGCDGVRSSAGCRTEKRYASNGWFPRTMKPKENPFYLDLPYDDLNDKVGLAKRRSVIPWARTEPWASRGSDRSLMKNRWVRITRGGRVCYGQVEDAGPGQYHDSKYVFGHTDARPANKRYNNAGMDVSPALNGCLRFTSLDGDSDKVNWRFVDSKDVPKGPWRKIITRSY